MSQNPGDLDPAAAPHGGRDEPTSAAANLFDLRTVIGVLFVVYGLVVTGVGLFATDQADIAKAGSNINLQSGLVMLVSGLLFFLWVYLRPVKLPDAAEIERLREEDDRPGH